MVYSDLYVWLFLRAMGISLAQFIKPVVVSPWWWRQHLWNVIELLPDDRAQHLRKQLSPSEILGSHGSEHGDCCIIAAALCGLVEVYDDSEVLPIVIIRAVLFLFCLTTVLAAKVMTSRLWMTNWIGFWGCWCSLISYYRPCHRLSRGIQETRNSRREFSCTPLQYSNWASSEFKAGAPTTTSQQHNDLELLWSYFTVILMWKLMSCHGKFSMSDHICRYVSVCLNLLMDVGKLSIYIQWLFAIFIVYEMQN